MIYRNTWGSVTSRPGKALVILYPKVRTPLIPSSFVWGKNPCLINPKIVALRSGSAAANLSVTKSVRVDYPLTVSEEAQAWTIYGMVGVLEESASFSGGRGLNESRQGTI